MLKEMLNIIILEKPNIVIEKIFEAMNNLPTDWDMLYFEYCYEKCNKLKEFNDVLYKVQEPLCAASIMYNCNSIDRIIDCIDTNRLNLDNAYAKWFKNKKLEAFLLAPPLFFQENSFNTNIQNNKITYCLK